MKMRLVAVLGALVIMLVCGYLLVSAQIMLVTGHQVWPWEGVQGFNGINGGVAVTYPK